MHVLLKTYFSSGKATNTHHRGDESPFGNWSSGIGFNSSIDSSIKEAEYEDRISPDNAL